MEPTLRSMVRLEWINSLVGLFWFGSGDCYPPALVFNCVSEERDGDLRSWINRERFPNYSKIDSYTLYDMGESGNFTSLRDEFVLYVEDISSGLD